MVLSNIALCGLWQLMKENHQLTAVANVIRLLWHVSMDQFSIRECGILYNYSRSALGGQTECQTLGNNLPHSFFSLLMLLHTWCFSSKIRTHLSIYICYACTCVCVCDNLAYTYKSKHTQDIHFKVSFKQYYCSPKCK